FKDQIKDYQTREVATLLGELTEAMEDLKAAGKDREQEMSKRWRASYDYGLARLGMQVAFLQESTTRLGSGRTDPPPRPPHRLGDVACGGAPAGGAGRPGRRRRPAPAPSASPVTRKSASASWRRSTPTRRGRYSPGAPGPRPWGWNGGRSSNPEAPGIFSTA